MLYVFEEVYYCIYIGTYIKYKLSDIPIVDCTRVVYRENINKVIAARKEIMESFLISKVKLAWLKACHSDWNCLESSDLEQELLGTFGNPEN